MLLLPGGKAGEGTLQLHPQICAHLRALLDNPEASGEIKIIIRHGEFERAEIDGYRIETGVVKS